MAAYSLDTLLNRWGLHQLTPEQAIGQILLILHELEPRILRLEQAITAPRVAAPPPPPPPAVAPTPTANPRKRKPRRRVG
ncbi:MAG: hypothetical protein EYC68_10280 [Chloroflexota bacterium]|nr:MAG: hypothetical protein EYC68_10280 [Chloroflexota bacterium]